MTSYRVPVEPGIQFSRIFRAAVKLTAALFILTGCLQEISAQNFPDYSERSLLTPKNTVKQEEKPVENMPERNTFSGMATEGRVDDNEYLVGPGDRFFITITGVSELNFEAVVNLEGEIFIPRVGITEADGKTLHKVKDEIRKKIAQVYRNVDMSVSLVQYKTVKISLIGNVLKPASIEIPANSRILDVISISSGIQPSTDLRNIRIISRDGKEKHSDMISFLRQGDKSQNPYVNQGDIISLSKSDRTVSVLGSVLYPGTYEYREGENAGNLISICGGFMDRSRKDSIEITSYLDDNKTLRSRYFSADQLSSYIMQRGDRIIVREKPEFLPDYFITITGFVKYPGTYKIIKEKTTLRELIEKEAGGFRPEASLKDAYIVRSSGDEEIDQEYERLKTIQRTDMSDEEYDYFKAKSRHKKGRMVVDFERLFLNNDRSEDLVLNKGDQVFVPEKKDYITLVGQIVHPGNITFDPALKVEDYIRLSGGYSWRAVENDIRVIKASTHEWFEADEVKQLEPGDIIWVPEETPPPKFWNVFTTTLTVLGQVATVIAATVAIIATTK